MLHVSVVPFHPWVIFPYEDNNILFIHWPVLDIMNKVTIIIWVPWICLHFWLGKCLQVGLLGCIASLCLIWKNLPNCFPEWLYHFVFTLHTCEIFSCPTSSVSVWCCQSYLSFNLHFPNGEWCSAGFHTIICHLYMFFGEESVQIFCHFFFLVRCGSSFIYLEKCFLWICVYRCILLICGLLLQQCLLKYKRFCVIFPNRIGSSLWNLI